MHLAVTSRREAISTQISTRCEFEQGARSAWDDEYHQIMILGVEQATIEADGAEDLLGGLLQVIAARTFGG